MISFILKIMIIVYLLYTIRYIHSMLQYNEKATIIHIEDPSKDKISVDIKGKCPLFITRGESSLKPSVSLLYLQSITPGYIIDDNKKLISLDELSSSPNVVIDKNVKIVTDLELSEYISSEQDLFDDIFQCNKQTSLSIYKGEVKSTLKKNYNELLLIQPVSGTVTLYLFNPKHETDIKGIDTTMIKKWGIKLSLTKDNILYIPPEWYYMYESTEEALVMYTEIDTISTVLFNKIRKK